MSYYFGEVFIICQWNGSNVSYICYKDIDSVFFITFESSGENTIEDFCITCSILKSDWKQNAHSFLAVKLCIRQLFQVAAVSFWAYSDPHLEKVTIWRGIDIQCCSPGSETV